MQHWLVFRKDGNAPPLVVYEERVSGFKRSPVYNVKGPFALADQLEGAVGALQQAKSQLTRIKTPAERESGAAEAFVIVCEALDRVRGQ